MNAIPEYQEILSKVFTLAKTSSQTDISKNRDVYELHSSEISILESNHNISISKNWENVFIIQSSLDKLLNQEDVSNTLKKIRNCIFHGTVFIEVITSDTVKDTIQSLILMSGFYDTTFNGYCYLESNTHISRSIVSNTYIGSQSIIISSTITCDHSTMYGLNQPIEVGSESGGRMVHVYPGMYYSTCVDQVFHLSSHPRPFVPNTVFSNDRLTFIGSKSYILNCSTFRNTIVSGDIFISNAFIDTSIILNINIQKPRVATDDSDTSNALMIVIEGNPKLTNCMIHSGCSISSSAYLNKVYLFENTLVGEYARLHNVILGPDSSISGGECHHSIVGPFTGFHHQALLIACLWPYGRGNIAYGAKIGSNHSGRLNDQECWMGEGVFIGLDVSIRYPFNCIEAPYSIIASGTICQSQRIDFPFSLITNCDSNILNTSIGNLSTYNMIKPSWMLYGNAYFIERSIIKYRLRRKSVNHKTDYDIFRPYIINLVKSAIDKLTVLIKESQGSKSSEYIVLDKCILSVKDARKGVESYEKFIQRYECQVFVDMIQRKENNINVKTVAGVNTKPKLQSYQGPISTTILVPVDYDQRFDKPSFDVKSIVSMLSDHTTAMTIDTKIYDSEKNLHGLQLLHQRDPTRFSISGVPPLNSTTESDDKTSDAIKINEVKIILSIEKHQILSLLERWVKLEEENLNSVRNSREKDNERGVNIIPDYKTSNEYMRNGTDSVVDSVQRRLDNLKKIMALISYKDDR